MALLSSLRGRAALLGTNSDRSPRPAPFPLPHSHRGLCSSWPDAVAIPMRVPKCHLAAPRCPLPGHTSSLRDAGSVSPALCSFGAKPHSEPVPTPCPSPPTSPAHPKTQRAPPGRGGFGELSHRTEPREKWLGWQGGEKRL